MLKAENLTKMFRSGEEEVIVFEDLNFEIRQGELVALVGESGSGKSTLLHLLAALDTPTRGDVYFNRKRVAGFSEKERAGTQGKSPLEFGRRLAGAVGTEEAVGLTRLHGEVHGLHSFELAVPLGELDGLDDRRGAALGRAYVTTGNLDHRTAEHVMSVLEVLHRDHGLTSVVATHNLDLARRAGRLLCLTGGGLSETVFPQSD